MHMTAWSYNRHGWLGVKNQLSIYLQYEVSDNFSTQPCSQGMDVVKQCDYVLSSHLLSCMHIGSFDTFVDDDDDDEDDEYDDHDCYKALTYARLAQSAAHISLSGSGAKSQRC